MPMYMWECESCGAVVEVLRSLSNYETCPDSTESPDCEALATDGHAWRRLIQTPLVIAKGPNWGAGKGNW